jgi:ADP-heptose:LPS heptosyltransferase
MMKFALWYADALRSTAVSWGGLAASRLRETIGDSSSEYARITILQSGGMGDAVLTLPLIEGLHRRWPRAKLSIVTKKLAKKVFEAFTPDLQLDLRDVDAYGHSNEGAIIDHDVDLLVHLRGDSAAMLAAWKCRSARYVCGLPRQSRMRWAPMYYLGLPMPHSREHQYDTFRLVMRPFGIELPPSPSITVQREWRESLNEKLRNEGIEHRRLVLIHPFAAWLPRSWTLDRWREICKHLHDDLDLEVCAIGGPEDVRWTDKFRDVGFPIRSLVGGLSIGELAALCERAVLFVGNDSGPAHVAAAAGARCVVLYGPQEASLFGVRSPKAVTIQGRSFCTPCWQKLCPFSPVRCMDRISVDAVRAAISTVLSIQE